MKYLKSLILLLTFSMLSCAGGFAIKKQFSLDKILPRTSFVKVESVYTITKCVDGSCFQMKMMSTSSGSVVKKYQHGAYVLTTGHSCDPKFAVNQLGPNTKIKQDTFLIDIYGAKHETITINIDNTMDTCILYSESIPHAAVKIGWNSAPVQGDKIYNLAAPVGVFNKHTMPILEGRFSGWMWGMSMYTVPAIGGSSGSPLFNTEGKLVGMIHSVHRRFHHLSFSPKHDELMKYISTNTPFTVPEPIKTEISTMEPASEKDKKGGTGDTGIFFKYMKDILKINHKHKDKFIRIR